MDSVFARGEEFLLKNARLLERHLFAFHFRNGPREPVIATLRAYQNPDGGFGHALEPDIRCPDSQPVPAQHALEFLDAVGFEPQIVQQICDYLTTIATDACGVPWLLPSAMAYPRAPWWNTDDSPPASLNPTATIAALLHKNHYQHPWLERATQFCWQRIDGLEPAEMHDLGVALEFLYHAPDRPRAERELERLAQHMLQAGLVADVHAEGYVRKPLDWAPTPDHPLRAYLPADQVEAHLDFLLAEQQEDGGWPVLWPTLSPGCEQEWRGWITLTKLLTLRANGRLFV